MRDGHERCEIILRQLQQYEGWPRKIRDYSSPATAVLVIYASLIDWSTHCTSEGRLSSRIFLGITLSNCSSHHRVMRCSYKTKTHFPPSVILVQHTLKIATFQVPPVTFRKSSPRSAIFDDGHLFLDHIKRRVGSCNSKPCDCILKDSTERERERECLGGNCFKNGSE